MGEDGGVNCTRQMLAFICHFRLFCKWHSVNCIEFFSNSLLYRINKNPTLFFYQCGGNDIYKLLTIGIFKYLKLDVLHINILTLKLKLSQHIEFDPFTYQALKI